MKPIFQSILFFCFFIICITSCSKKIKKKEPEPENNIPEEIYIRPLITEKFDSINWGFIKDKLLEGSQINSIAKEKFVLKGIEKGDENSEYFSYLIHEPMLVGLYFDYLTDDEIILQFSQLSEERKKQVIKILIEIHCRRIANSEALHKTFFDHINKFESKKAQLLFHATQFFHLKKDEILEHIYNYRLTEGILNTDGFALVHQLLMRYAYKNIDTKAVDILKDLLSNYKDEKLNFSNGYDKFHPDIYHGLRDTKEYQSAFIYIYQNSNESIRKELKKLLIDAVKVRKSRIDDLIFYEVSDDMKLLLNNYKPLIDNFLAVDYSKDDDWSYITSYALNFGYDAILDIMSKYPAKPITELNKRNKSGAVLEAIKEFLLINPDLDADKREVIFSYLNTNKFAASDNWSGFITSLHLLYPNSKASQFKDMLLLMDEYHKYWMQKPSEHYEYNWVNDDFQVKDVAVLKEFGLRDNLDLYTPEQEFYAGFDTDYIVCWHTALMYSQHSIPLTYQYDFSQFSGPILAKLYAHKFPEIITKTEIFNITDDSFSDEILIVYTDRDNRTYGITSKIKMDYTMPNPIYSVVSHILNKNNSKLRLVPAITNGSTEFIMAIDPKLYLKLAQNYVYSFDYGFYDLNEME